MTDRQRSDLDNQPTEFPERLADASTAPLHGGEKFNEEINPDEAFLKEFGYRPQDFQPQEMKPVQVKSALRGTKHNGFFSIIAPGVGRLEGAITNDLDHAEEYVENLPTNTIFGVDQTSLHDEREGKRHVVLFRKLSSGTLQPLRVPGPLRQRKEEDSFDGLPINPDREIVDTVVG